ncbi:MAG: PD40 domain-containing protein [Bacteroidales bacterium]|nr:PD40 domain-containing protein [Bacteroidales bacterium]
MRFFTIFSLFLSVGVVSFGQVLAQNEKKAELLHNEYKFEQAVGIYNKVLEQTSDSLKRIVLEGKIIQSENGNSLLDFVFEPVVVARETFARKDFFLRYPGFADSVWTLLPEALSPHAKQGEFPVIQFPEGCRKLYFSAPDNSGSWNIYYTAKLNDTLWSTPSILNENVTSIGNELFPVLSADGKSLYFSSNGHYGVGGYDLYVSEWDDESQDWGVPQNMGFPYSSPADDLLFYNTPDGLYSLFASNRNCSADSLVIYVIEFENMPLKRPVTSEEAAKIALLPLKGGAAQGSEQNDVADMTELASGNNNQYAAAVAKVRGLQERVKEAVAKERASRELYNTLKNQDDLKALERTIAQQEVATLALQNEVNQAVRELQAIELEFLSKGIFIPQLDLDSAVEDSNDAKGGSKNKFVFALNKLGKTPVMSVEVPEPEIDLSFRILDTAQLVDMSEFPQGLVYQIQLFTLSKKATIKSLKGLSPVFERKSSNGKYTYSAGIFDNYKAAMSNLNKVRKKGFSSAAVTAYNNGKSMNVTKARALEMELAESAAYQVVIAGYSGTLPQEVLTVIRTTTEKDIAKTTEGGQTIYVIGPFGKVDEANMLATALKAVSDKSVNVKKVE